MTARSPSYRVLKCPDEQPHQGGVQRRSASSRVMRSAPRTSSRSASCRGCTRGRPSPRWSGSARIGSRSNEKVARGQHVRRSSQGSTSVRRSRRSATDTSVKPASSCPTGEYTNVTGNTALVVGSSWPPSQLAKLPVTLGSYPITPASATSSTSCPRHKHFGIRTVQAEDEIAAVGHGARRGVRRAPRRHHHLAGRACR